eukprot:TRINITY_DN434_c0_g1_i1.p1 TRINITY_DN434_c0_g1~~TRINITY_DN434_c0_g1_i1.p1  ORF type:complete len:872 (+),score=171.46 TRINITY_DN434_c0_g1_i1:153-2768(+)
MTETMTEMKKSGDESSISSFKDNPFQRRIEFHLARKTSYPYSSSSNAASDFHLETLNPSSDRQRPGTSTGGCGPSGSAGKKSDGGGDILEHGLDPELRFEITFRRIGAGLANLGNTCFLNSVLQCLTYTEPFAAYLQSGKHKSSCHTAGFCALCAIQNHVRSALQSTGKILSPLHLVKNLRCISRNFRNSRQEDAHEYMVNLLESMHKCCLPSGVSSESPSAYEKSLVHNIFGGRLRSQVKCMQCSYCSNKFDPFLDLSLEIVRADSLRRALAHFTAKEQLDGGEKQYQCQRCKEKVRALKQLTVHKAPYVLTIHLKRFGSDVPGEKIDRKVDFGPSLDLKPFVSGPYEGDLKYTLYGVLVHAGWSTHSGHYYCFVRTSSGMWYSLDDNRVFQVSERTVLEQKAYMLFYVRDRKSTAAPKKPLDVVSRDTVASNTMGNKELLVSSLGSNEAIQNGQMERGLDASKCASSITRSLPVSSHCQSTSTVRTSLQQPITKVASGLQSNDRVSGDPIVPTSITGGAGSMNEFARTTLGSEHHTFDSRTNQEAGKDSNIMVSKQNGHYQPENSSSKKLPMENGMHEFQDSASLIEKGPLDLTHPQNLGVDHLLGEPKPELKPKPKKPIKSPVIKNMFFGPKRLFLAAPSLQRKKKQKRSKRHTLDIWRHAQKDIIGDTSNDPGTSTSEKDRVVDCMLMRRKKRRHHGTLNKKRSACRASKSSNDCSVNSFETKEKGPEERIGPHVAILATDQQLEKTSISIETQCDVQDKRGLVRHGIMSMLTRGLEMPTVARWDGIESPSSEAFGLGDAQNGSIGYVLDEWDEEYDRGKRKKVRKSDHSFSGRNPFQEIAMKKTHMKMKMKMTMDRTSAGNQPFRI